jgi:hypothetical protein
MSGNGGAVANLTERPGMQHDPRGGIAAYRRER